MLELWLVRHGETVWNAAGRVQGRSDPELSETGCEQARRLGSRLEHTAFTAVVSSDLQRAVQTAKLALPDAPLQTDPRLRELDFGAWEGRTWGEVAAADPEALTAWYANPYVNAPTGGEGYAALVRRTRGWSESLPKSGRVLAFTHGGPIRGLLYTLTGVPDGHTWRFDPGPASLTKLTLGEYGAILHTVGDVAHLEAAHLEAAHLEER